MTERVSWIPEGASDWIQDMPSQTVTLSGFYDDASSPLQRFLSSDPVRAELLYPANRWQAFKQAHGSARWMRWLVARRPVRYVSAAVVAGRLTADEDGVITIASADPPPVAQS